jgi:hypothetical protein
MSLPILRRLFVWHITAAVPSVLLPRHSLIPPFQVVPA